MNCFKGEKKKKKYICWSFVHRTLQTKASHLAEGRQNKSSSNTFTVFLLETFFASACSKKNNNICLRNTVKGGQKKLLFCCNFQRKCPVIEKKGGSMLPVEVTVK